MQVAGLENQVNNKCYVYGAVIAESCVLVNTGASVFYLDSQQEVNISSEGNLVETFLLAIKDRIIIL